MKALSLHIGINQVDNKYYHGFVPPLSGCVNDMERMEKLAKQFAFTTKSLKNEEATKEKIEYEIKNLASTLDTGGILLITYAGHGAQIPDKDGDTDSPEKSRMDQAWVTYNGFLLDDKLNEIMCLVSEGRRVLIISDSCFSGSMTRAALDDEFSAYHKKRSISVADVRKILASRNETGETIRAGVLSADKLSPKASIKLLSACTDTQPAMESENAGLYTDTFLNVFNELMSGKDRPAYQIFQNKIAERIKNRQSPGISDRGFADQRFDNQFPLSIEFEATGNSSPPPIPPVTEPPSIPLSKPGKKFRKFSVEGGEQFLELPNASRALMGEDVPVHGSVVVIADDENQNPWDMAYAILKANHAKDLTYVEPDIVTNINCEPAEQEKRGQGEYIPSYPNPVNDFPQCDNPFIWHLDEKTSQLKNAREEVFPHINVNNLPENENDLVRIAHIDTGYLEGHITSPRYFDYTSSYTIQALRETEGAIDYDYDFYPGEQQGHGNATRALLAGNYLTKENTGGQFQGFFGANPFARVTSIKISDTVVLLSGRHFAAAVDYAIEQKCEVITMSMAGLPSRVMARAVNKAYEHGIVIVSAAGNCFVKGVARITPNVTLYPARFDRVISAVGSTCNGKPYLYELNHQRSADGEFMQTCYGPESVLDTTLAAYTPNVVWFNSNDPDRRYVKTGGGTSSATPQIAAAASLYIQKYRKELEELAGSEKWKKAEMVRLALFKAADRQTQYNHVYGRGLLKAQDALKYIPADLNNEITKAREAKAGIVFLKIINLFRNRMWSTEEADKLNAHLKEMLCVELSQVMYRDLEISQAFSDIENDDPDFDILKYPRLTEFIAAVQKSPKASEFLKSAIQEMIGVNASSTGGTHGEVTLTRNSRGTVKVSSTGYTVVRSKLDTPVPASPQTWVDEFEIFPLSQASRDITDAGIVIKHNYTEEGMDAAMLVEEEVDGVKIRRWIFQNDGAEATSRSMEVTMEEDSFSVRPAQSGTRGGIGKFLVRIFKWLKPKSNTVGESIASFLANMEDTKYGLYACILSEGQATSWTPLNEVITETIKQSGRPIVLVLPGLLSTIEKGFDDFLSLDQVQQTILDRCTPIVLGFNMPTLKTGNAANAVELCNELKRVGLWNKEFVVIARSSGTLVARYLIESNADFSYSKFIFMGGANQGTAIASSKHWKKLLNGITNFAGITFGAPAPWLPAILSFVKAIAIGAFKLPGLSDLEEGSPFLAALNSRAGVDTSRYFAIATDYEPRGILKKISDELVVDRLLFRRMSNDILVPNAGTFFLDSRYPTSISIPADNRLVLNGSATTSHFKYLEDEKVRAFILKQL